MSEDNEKCPFCGITTDTPCDAPPPTMCSIQNEQMLRDVTVHGTAVAVNNRRVDPAALYPEAPRAWFTIDELNAWADKKLKENPQWAEQPAQQQEPVAWLIAYEVCCGRKNRGSSLKKFDEVWAKCSFVSEDKDAEINASKWRNRKETPVYTSPQPAPVPEAHKQQEPVLWLVNGVVQSSDIPKDYTGCLFTSPQPSKPWVGLTDEDIWEIYKQTDSMQYMAFSREIEAKLREKNA